MKAYLANGLFNEADTMYNEYVGQLLELNFPDVELYIPQRNLAINDKNAYADSLMIANGDDEHLFASNFMVAIIDKEDEGVACEVGTFQTLGQLEREMELEHTGKVYDAEHYRPIFALYTDSRQMGRDNPKKIEALQNDPVENQFPYKNLYYIGKIKKSGGAIYSNTDDLIYGIKQWMIRTKV